MLNRSELARLFWGQCADPLGGALLACRLLKSLADEASTQEESDLAAHFLRALSHFRNLPRLAGESKNYERLACGVLSACYERNPSMARRLLVRRLGGWGRTTCFSLAESSQLMDFMQLACCQSKLNQIWYGNLVEHTTDWKVRRGS